MKGGDVLALGVLRALAERPAAGVRRGRAAARQRRGVAEVPFAHVDRFAGFDACLCFEAGQLGPDGEEAVVVRRKAAGTLRVGAYGREAHSGSAPDKGATRCSRSPPPPRPSPPATTRAARTASPPSRRSSSGEAFNVVPGAGELIGDLPRRRAPTRSRRVLDAIPRRSTASGSRPSCCAAGRAWTRARRPSRCSPAPRELLGRPSTPAARGGASDASHFAAAIPVTVDGLGPRGGHAHHPDEFVWRTSLSRAPRSRSPCSPPYSDRRRELPEALRDRPFRLLFLAQATSLLGDGMVSVALAFAVLELTGSAADLGIVLAARTAPLVVFLLVGGVWADRLPGGASWSSPTSPAS